MNRNCPEFAYRQRVHGLVCLEKRRDILPIQTQFRMENEVLGQKVHVWQPPEVIRGRSQ